MHLSISQIEILIWQYLCSRFKSNHYSVVTRMFGRNCDSEESLDSCHDILRRKFKQLIPDIGKYFFLPNGSIRSYLYKQLKVSKLPLLVFISLFSGRYGGQFHSICASIKQTNEGEFNLLFENYN